jgi:hypothetical protein
VNKNSIGGTIGKNLKKLIITFQKKKIPNRPPHGIFIRPLVPQKKEEKLAKVSLWPKCLWPKCHSGQTVNSKSDTGQTVSLAKVSGQSVPTKVSLAKVSF